MAEREPGRQSSTLNSGNRYSGYLNNLKPAGFWVVVLVLVLTILFRALDIRASLDPPYLAFCLNTLFLLIPSLPIAVVTIRGFSRTGSWPVLWLGIGTLTFAIGAILGGLLMPLAGGNIAVTVSNLIFFVGAALHFSAGFWVFSNVPDHKDVYARQPVILLVYLGVMVLILSFLAIGLQELLPPFFIHGSGGTPLRQMVVGASVIMFLFSFLVFLSRYFRNKSPLIYWYALGLLMLALGMGGILMQTALGTPLNWMGRISMYFGGLFLMAASLVTMHEARIKKIPADESIAGVLSVTESKLKKAEKRFQMVFERAEVGIAIGSADGRVVEESNPALERMLGYSKAELKHKPFPEFTYPEDVSLELSLIDDLITGKREYYEIEKRYIRKDGNMIWVKLIGSLVRGDDGEPLFGVALVEDITERKKAEARLKDIAEKYASLFDNTSDGVWIHNFENRIIEVNNAYCAMSGYSREEIIGMPVSQLEAVESPEEVDGHLKKILKTGGHDHFESKHRRKDGTIFDVDITALYLEREGGQIAVFVRDITERKKAEQIKDEFIGMVSHELKTPLTVTMAALYTLQEKGLTEDEIRELIQDAINSAESLAGIMENLLELSRSQAHRLELHTEMTDISEIARDVIEKLKSKSSLHHLTLNFPEGMETIEVDPVRVERVLFNLVENAIKYSPKGGEVGIYTRHQDNVMVVCVRDQGPGISPDDQKRLFQSFEQLEIDNRRAMQGVGLGLKVCRTLVEAHGGRIWVESEPGKGATFCFTLLAGDSHNRNKQIRY